MHHAIRGRAEKDTDTVAAMTGHYNQVHIPLTDSKISLSVADRIIQLPITPSQSFSRNSVNMRYCASISFFNDSSASASFG